MRHGTRVEISLGLVLIAMFALPHGLNADKNKKEEQRGMLEKMDSVPCGAKERGLSGLGAVYGSIGLTHVNTQEKLCMQYLLRTDDMDYEIRPTNTKNPVLLPVGKEAEFKLKHNQIYLRLPDGDSKTRTYNVISSNPNRPDLDSDSDKSASASPEAHSSSEQH